MKYKNNLAPVQYPVIFPNLQFFIYDWKGFMGTCVTCVFYLCCKNIPQEANIDLTCADCHISLLGSIDFIYWQK